MASTKHGSRSGGRGSSRSRAKKSRTFDLPQWPDLLLPLVVAAAVTLGGASAAGAIPNALVQLLAVGSAWLVFVRTPGRTLARSESTLLLIGAIFLIVALLQLVPLPPELWRTLPGRAPIAEQFRLLGVGLPWLPLSLTPGATIAGIAAMSIPAAVAVLVHRTPDDGLSRFAWAVVLLAAVSVVVGFLQLVSGGQSPLYLYTITNRGQPVGFFANSNHLATLELMALPLLAALAARSRGDGEAAGQAGNLVMLGTLAIILLLGIATNGSLAGLGLLLPTLIGCFLLFRGGRSRRIALIGFAVALVVVGAFIVLALNSPLVSGYAATSLDAAPTSRMSFIEHGLMAIRSYFPFGSGLGSFVSVYPAFEDADRVSSVFVNHAHNDYIELVLDLGAAGVALILAFLGWWAWRVVAIWRDRESGVMLRAATVSTAVVLAHSLVDYPGRTAAIMAIFAACCMTIARPGRVRAAPPPVVPREDAAPARHLSA